MHAVDCADALGLHVATVFGDVGWATARSRIDGVGPPILILPYDGADWRREDLGDGEIELDF